MAPALGGGNVLQMSSSGKAVRYSGFSSTVAASIATTAATPLGASIDNGLNFLSICQASTSKIRKYAGFTTTVSSSIASPVSTGGCDVTWDQTRLYSTNQNDLKSYQHSLFTTTIKASFAYSANNEPFGISTDGTFMYIADQGTSGKKTRKHSLFTSGIKSSLSMTTRTLFRGTCWDGTDLISSYLTATKNIKYSAFTSTIKNSFAGVVTNDNYGIEWDAFYGSQGGAQSLTKALASAVAFSSALEKRDSIIKNSSITFAESHSRVSAFKRAITTLLAFSEIVKFSVGKINTSALSFVESNAKFISSKLTSAISFIDTLSLTVVFEKIFSAALTMSDKLTHLVLKVNSSVISFAESQFIEIAKLKQLSSSFSLLTFSGSAQSQQGPLHANVAQNVYLGPSYVDWTNPSNAKAEDGIFATSSYNADSSNRLQLSSYGFSIPAGATVDGVLVEMKAKKVGAGGMSLRVMSLNGEVSSFYDQALTTTNTYYSFGGAASLWNLTLNPTKINSSDFGVGVVRIGGGTSTTASVDDIRITVYYTVVYSAIVFSVLKRIAAAIQFSEVASYLLSRYKALTATISFAESVTKSAVKKLIASLNLVVIADISSVFNRVLTSAESLVVSSTQSVVKILELADSVTFVSSMLRMIMKKLSSTINLVSITNQSGIVDFYSEANQSDTNPLSALTNTDIGQTFTGLNAILTHCKFYLKKGNSPTGTMLAKVYATTGTFGSSSVPTGSALATSESVNISVLTTSFQLITFNFVGANRIQLTEGVHYAVVVESLDGDAVNVVLVGAQYAGSSHPGNRVYSTDGGAGWSANAPSDDIFYVYGAAIPGLSFSVGKFVTAAETLAASAFRKTIDFLSLTAAISFADLKTIQTIKRLSSSTTFVETHLHAFQKRMSTAFSFAEDLIFSVSKRMTTALSLSELINVFPTIKLALSATLAFSDSMRKDIVKYTLSAISFIDNTKKSVSSKLTSAISLSISATIAQTQKNLASALTLGESAVASSTNILALLDSAQFSESKQFAANKKLFTSESFEDVTTNEISVTRDATVSFAAALSKRTSIAHSDSIAIVELLKKDIEKRYSTALTLVEQLTTTAQIVSSLSEALLFAESLNKSVISRRIDSTAFTENISILKYFTQTLSDGIDLLRSMSRVDISKRESNSIGLTAVHSKTITTLRDFVDSFNFVAATSKSANIAQDDALIFSEQITDICLVILTQLSQALAISEKLELSSRKNLTDVIVLEEITNNLIELVRSDDVSVAGNLTIEKIVRLEEQLSVLISLYKNAGTRKSSTLSLLETLKKEVQTRKLSALGMTDDRISEVGISLHDDTLFDEIFIRSGDLSLTDYLTLQSAFQKVLSLTFTDDIAFEESFEYDKQTVLTFTEIITIADNLNLHIDVFKKFVTQLSLTESVNAVNIKIHELSAILTLLDSITTRADKHFISAFDIAESFETNATIRRDLTDSEGFSDSSRKSVSVRRLDSETLQSSLVREFGFTDSEAIAFTDSHRIERIEPYKEKTHLFTNDNSACLVSKDNKTLLITNSNKVYLYHI